MTPPQPQSPLGQSAVALSYRERFSIEIVRVLYRYKVRFLNILNNLIINLVLVSFLSEEHYLLEKTPQIYFSSPYFL